MCAKVVTIGYKETDADLFFACLQRAGVSRLLDVRAAARSRKKEFNRSHLRKRCAAEGIEYVHLPQSGAPKAPRQRYLEDGDWETFQTAFTAHLQEHPEAVDDLETQARDGSVLSALMCVCRDPERCHRGLLAQRLESRGHTVEHQWPETKGGR